MRSFWRIFFAFWDIGNISSSLGEFGWCGYDCLGCCHCWLWELRFWLWLVLVLYVFIYKIGFGYIDYVWRIWCVVSFVVISKVDGYCFIGIQRLLSFMIRKVVSNYTKSERIVKGVTEVLVCPS